MFELVRCHFSGLEYFAYSDELRALYISRNIFMIMKLLTG